MLTVYPAINLSEQEVHYFDSKDAIQYLQVMDGNGWKAQEPFKVEKVCNFKLKNKNWLEKRYVFS